MKAHEINERLLESEHPLARLYQKRVEQDRDLVVLVTDSSNDRGTGKTTLALQLAAGMDRTDKGLTKEKVALDPRPMSKAYTEKPRGSGLVLDETEVGMDKYQSGSKINKAIRELVSMGRVEQKYLVLNAPADHLVDQDLKSLVDVWILVQRRGMAQVYRMDWEPHRGHELTHNFGTLNWDAIPRSSQLHDIYKHLTVEKEERLRGEESDAYIERSKAKEMVENARKDARTETRDKIIRELKKFADQPDYELDQGDIGEAVSLSRSRVSQI